MIMGFEYTLEHTECIIFHSVIKTNQLMVYCHLLERQSGKRVRERDAPSSVLLPKYQVKLDQEPEPRIQSVSPT